MKNNSYRTSLFYLFIFFILESLPAQTLNLQTIPSDKIQIGLSFEKPFYSNNNDMSTLSGVYQFSFNIPISPKLNIISNIPYMKNSYKFDDGFSYFNFPEKGFGNIFIGLQTNQETIDDRRSIVSFGLFLPTAQEKTSYSGLFTNYYDIQKYIPNTVGVYFNYAYHKISKEGLSYGIEVGPNMLIPTKGNNSRTKVYMHYGIIAGFQINKLSLNIEFLGIAIITKAVKNFSDRLIHLLNFGAQLEGTIIKPKIFYKIYLKEKMIDIIDGVLGIGVSVSIDQI